MCIVGRNFADVRPLHFERNDFGYGILHRFGKIGVAVDDLPLLIQHALTGRKKQGHTGQTDPAQPEVYASFLGGGLSFRLQPRLCPSACDHRGDP